MRKILFVILAAIMLSGCVVGVAEPGYGPYYGSGYHSPWRGYHHSWH